MKFESDKQKLGIFLFLAGAYFFLTDQYQNPAIFSVIVGMFLMSD